MICTMEWWLGTLLVGFGITASFFALMVGCGALLAEAYAGDHSIKLYLLITAALWGAVGAYFLWWGSRVRE